MNAIIFAAGLGTRLKPFTLEHPKALAEVNGIPMLQRVIERLKAAGVTDIVVNVHHFAQQIIDFLKANGNFGCDIMISDESGILLDTGGGIAKAAPLLGNAEPFIAYNADILSDFNIADMVAAHRNSGADVTLLTSHRHSSRRLYFNAASHRLRGWKNSITGECRPTSFDPDAEDGGTRIYEGMSFNGVHIISPGVLPLLQQKAAETPVFSITPFYLENICKLDIRSYTPAAPCQWYDIGRNETLAEARAHFRE